MSQILCSLCIFYTLKRCKPKWIKIIFDFRTSESKNAVHSLFECSYFQLKDNLCYKFLQVILQVAQPHHAGAGRDWSPAILWTLPDPWPLGWPFTSGQYQYLHVDIFISYNFVQRCIMGKNDYWKLIDQIFDSMTVYCISEHFFFGTLSSDTDFLNILGIYSAWKRNSYTSIFQKQPK